MSDQGDWWARLGNAAPQVGLRPPHRPGGRHHRRHRRDRRDPSGGRRRLLPGVIAATAALALLLTGGALAIKRVNQPFTAGALTGLLPAKDTSATAHQAPSPVPTPSATPAPVLTVNEVTGRVRPGTVMIKSVLGYQDAEAAGTGLVLTPGGVILTNNHVIDGATRITVTVANTGRQYSATVVGTQPSSDIAVLQLQNAGVLATVPVANSDQVRVGQPVVGIGNAGGRGVLSVVTGTVTSIDRTITASDASGASSERLTGMIEVQAPIRAGDSGGPLANRAGQVIGMDTAASATRQGDQTGPTFGFAIPINRALSIAAKIRSDSNGTPNGPQPGGRGFLGVEVRSVDAATNTGGAEIVMATADSPADRAGLQSGDIITTLDGQAVASANSLTASLQQTKPGQAVTLGWSDQYGAAHSAEITLGAGPAD